jgi:tetratricopeptide (TPR) repeat protein
LLTLAGAGGVGKTRLARTAPARQQTLRATIDWSYGLLPETDRLMLDRLSVFAGGWTFEAAEAVCSGDGIAPDDVLDLLAGLVDRSLVVTETDVEGNIRYRLLEVLRQYGQERLAERGEVDSTNLKYASYFLARAQESELRILGPERKLWLDRMERELDNFRAVRRWFVGSGATEDALHLATALYRLWMYRGYANEGRASLVEALAMPGGSSPARARALFCDGGLGSTQADYPASLRLLQASLALWQEIGDERNCAWALMGVGAVATIGTNFDLASASLTEACRLSEEAGDTASLALSRAWYADMAYAYGDWETARHYAHEALRTADSIGFATPACMALSTMGNLHCREGTLDAAENALQAALIRAEALEEAYPIVRATTGLALLLARMGQMDRARALLARSVSLSQQVGNHLHIVQSLEGLATFAAISQEPAGAERSERPDAGTDRRRPRVARGRTDATRARGRGARRPGTQQPRSRRGARHQ